MANTLNVNARQYVPLGSLENSTLTRSDWMANPVLVVAQCLLVTL